jgi:hypothetical protein
MARVEVVLTFSQEPMDRDDFIRQLQSIITSLAERVYRQAEILTKCAEKKNATDSAKTVDSNTLQSMQRNRNKQ